MSVCTTLPVVPPTAHRTMHVDLLESNHENVTLYTWVHARPSFLVGARCAQCLQPMRKEIL